MPFCDRNFDFSILIETENNVTRSYCGYQSSVGIPSTPRNFIAVGYDGADSGSDIFEGVWSGSFGVDQWKFSSGEIYSKVKL